jgi:hypothetical protein
MKRLLVSLLAGFVLALAGCVVPPVDANAPALTPAEQSIKALTLSYNALDSAILAADAAVQNGTLKGQDARNALAAFTKTKEGLDTALVALRNANAAAAAQLGTKK